jgi:hypothetical protein
MITDHAPASSEWMTEILGWLLRCLNAREQVSWAEITERIEKLWLEKNGFGPPDVEIRALRGALIGETPPKTSGPPKPPTRKTPFTPPLLSSTVVSRKRGPKGLQRKRVINQMIEDIKRETITLAALSDEKEKTLEHRYGASRDTCRKARETVLRQLTPDK